MAPKERDCALYMNEQVPTNLSNGEVQINLVDLDGRKYSTKMLVGGSGQMNRANFYNTIERLTETIFREFENAERIYK